MIRMDGSVAQAETVESKIKNGTRYLCLTFRTACYEGGSGRSELGRDFKSRVFTREYEIFATAEEIKKVINKPNHVMDFILWLTKEPIRIKFNYDYRVGKCEVSVSYENWKRLIKLIPDLKDSVRIIEPNRCEIVYKV